MRRTSRIYSMMLCVALLQVAVCQDGGPPLGLIPHDAYDVGNIDHVALGTGNVVGTIPLVSFPQRGKLPPLSFSIDFNSSSWNEVETCDSYSDTCYVYFVNDPNIGAQVQSNFQAASINVGTIILSENGGSFYPPSPSVEFLTQPISITDETGQTHQMLYDVSNPSWARAVDGSGYSIYSSTGPEPWDYVEPSYSGTIYTPQGSTIQFVTANYPNATESDTAGNKISYIVSENSPYYYYSDSNNRVIPDPAHSTTGTNSNCPDLGDPNQPVVGSTLWTIPSINGGTSAYLFCYTSAVVQTGFYYGANGWLYPSSAPLEDCTAEFAALTADDSSFSANPTAAPTGYGVGACDNTGYVNALQSVVLPNGTSWKFLYDVSSPYTANGQTYWTEAYGTIKEIQLPTGGKIDYTFQNMSRFPGQFGYPSAYRAIASRVVDDGLGLPTSRNETQAYSYGQLTNGIMTTTETDGDSNQTVHEFTPLTPISVFSSSNLGYAETPDISHETKASFYQGSEASGTLLREVDTTYLGTDGSSNILPSSITIKTPSGVQSVEQRQYVSLGTLANYSCQITGTGPMNCSPYSGYGYRDITDYLDQVYQDNLYDGSGNLLRRTVSTPLYTQSGLYSTQPSLVSSYQVYDGAGNLTAQTTYGYDENNGSPSGAYGNLTSISKWLNTGSSSAVTSYVYNSQNMVTSVVDANGNAPGGVPAQHTTTIAYDGTGIFPSSVQDPTVNGVQHVTSYSYDSNTGRLLATTDYNGVQTQYVYSDALGRLTQIKQAVGTPNENWTSLSYPSMTQMNIAQDKNTVGDGALQSSIISDGLSRVIHQTDSAGNTVDTTYNSAGLVESVSNPHSSSPNSTDGTTSYTYDALGRKTVQTEQDGNALQWSYSGNTVVFTDEANHSWQRVSDALGRLTEVIEPGSLATTYQYNAVGDLICVDQWETGPAGQPCTSSHSRSFVYDSLSRLTSARNPETGTVTYSYDANGNLTQQTDARNVVISYSYDALNRRTSKQSSGAGGVSGFNYNYAYDTANLGAFTASNPIGRLVEASNNVNASEQYSYDAMGRITLQANTLPSICCNADSQVANEVQARYDLAGNTTSLTYPDGRVVDQTFNNLGQMLTSTFDNYNGQHVGYSYVTDITYTPAGAQAEIYLGNIAYIHTPYNSREQMCQVWSNGSRGFIDTHIYYGGSTIYCGNTPGNNGNITEVKDWKDSGLTRTFGYDALNRITSFSTGDATMQQSYSYDSFGNLQNQSGTLNSALTIGSNNQVTNSGFLYDAAGNTTQMNNGLGNQTYSYDAENKLLTVNSDAAAYTYDAENNRVRKDFGGNWREYVYFNGQPLAEKNSDGSWSDYIYANGQRIARADNSDIRIHFTGTNCSNCGPQAWAYDIPVPTGYTVQSGDSISWRQYQQGPAVPRGGLALAFSDGTYTNWVAEDQNQQVMNDLTTQNTWVYRSVDLSQYTGKTIVGGWINEDTNSGAGDWQEWFADIAYFRADGTVQPIFNRDTNVSYPSFGSSGVTNQTFEINTMQNDAWEPLDTTTYYLGDQIGSTRMTLAGGGWPMTSDMFYPFGQEQAAVDDPNHYKFTGKERDSESNLDYFGARYYGSSMGRFLSPDPTGLLYASLANPQSLNLYSYVLNNPLINVDPTGTECVWDDGSYDAADDPETGNAQGCSSQGGTYINPDLFENALLTNGQNANIQYGSWSGQANSTIASSWTTPSGTAYGSQWAAGQEVDEALGYFYGNGAKPTLIYGNNDPFTVSFKGSLGMQGILAGIRANCHATSGSVPVGTWEAFVNTMIDGPYLKSADGSIVSGYYTPEAQMGGFNSTYTRSGGVVNITVTNPITLNSFALHATAPLGIPNPTSGHLGTVIQQLNITVPDPCQ